MSKYRVGYFVGSLSASSNRLLAKALVRLAPAELDMTEIPLVLLAAVGACRFTPVHAGLARVTRPYIRRQRDSTRRS